MRGKSLLILLLIGYGIVYAQEDEPFQFGVKIGGNLYSTSMNVEDVADKKLKVGYQVGLTAEYAFTENFYLQSGVFFVTKGVKIKGKTGNSENEKSYSQSINLQYLQLPLLATFKLEMDTDIKAYFGVGPYIAYGIGGKSNTTNRYVDPTRADEGDNLNSFGDNRMKELDFGFKYNVGLEFEKFLFEWGYDFGLMNIERKNSKINSLLNNKHFKNKGISLSVGYKF